MIDATLNDLKNSDWYVEQMEGMTEGEMVTFKEDCISLGLYHRLTKGFVESHVKAAKRDLKAAEIMGGMVEINGIMLDTGRNGVESTAENFLRIFRSDKRFRGIRWNELSEAPECLRDGKYELWTDVDDAKSKNYIEKTYHISNDRKYDNALREYFDEMKQHPVRNMIEKLQWDGIERIETILTKWLKCEDTPYTREVSRLIFAGGINRVYRPGCKFDDSPVLIGTHQGEGKSSFVRWLAMSDEFYAEVNNIEGREGSEAIEGAWICEMGELLALTRAKEVEAVKAYMTRQVDAYRRPYDRRKTERKRQCVFIGTTNKRHFLIDKTGNRRFYPVVVNSVGFDLFDHEDEIKADIKQCWAEAKYLYDIGKLQPYMNRALAAEVQEAQMDATEEDWREPIIEQFIGERYRVCVREIWHEALKYPEDKPPTKRDSNEIGQILTRLGCIRSGTSRTVNYGPQMTWVNPKLEKVGKFEPTSSEF